MSSEKKYCVGFEIVYDYEAMFFGYNEWLNFITFKINQFIRAERIIEGVFGYAMLGEYQSKRT